jgi:hypothetical protein
VVAHEPEPTSIAEKVEATDDAIRFDDGLGAAVDQLRRSLGSERAGTWHRLRANRIRVHGLSFVLRKIARVDGSRVGDLSPFGRRLHWR